MGKKDQEAMAKKITEAEKEARKKERQAWKEFKKKDRESFWSDFKKFITRGNVIDMAVAVVVATAFNAIVNGLVKQIITPCVTYFTSGVSINEWEYVLREEVLDAEDVVEVSKISIQYGLWLQTIIDFIIIAFSIFLVVRIVKGMEAKLNAKEIARAKEEEAKKKAEEEAKAEEERKAQEAKDQAEREAKEREERELEEQAERARVIQMQRLRSQRRHMIDNIINNL